MTKPVLGKKGRIILIVVSSVLVAALVTGLCLYFFLFKKEDEGYYKYFNTFSSVDSDGAIARTNLSDGTTISAYNSADDVFITMRTFLGTGNSETVKYGLASVEGEYVLPIYQRIIQLKGDYAIVVRSPKEDGSETSTTGYIDVIRYRGEEGTPYSLMDGKSVPYSSVGYLPQFVGDYLVSFNELYDDSGAIPTFATFYEYKSWHKLLEKFRIRQAYDKSASTVYNFLQADNYVVSYNNDKAYFYNTNNKIINGYLEYADNGMYTAFPDFDDSALTAYNRQMNVYYIGNGWFVCSARLYTYTPFNGFNLLLMDTGLSEYSRTKVDFYNVRTGQSVEDKEIYYVAGVANKYTFDSYEQDVYLLGSLISYDDEYNVYKYELPFFNPAQMVRDGYSIVYYYYQPYHDVYPNDNETFYGYTGATTFCLFDEGLNKTTTENSLMPILYIDGVGVSNSDPIYTESRGTAYAYDKNMEMTTLASFKEGLETYYAYYGNKYACILECTFTDDSGARQVKFGAVTPDGKRITDFVYDEMTYYEGGYCIGQKKADGKAKYYRVDMLGNEEEIEDVLVLFQGVYTYKDGEKIGVKNYKGDVLIAPVEGTIDMSTSVLKNGKDVRTYAIVTANGRTTIYEITGSDK